MGTTLLTNREATRILAKWSEDPIGKSRILERFQDRDAGADPLPQPAMMEYLFVRTNYLIHTLKYSGYDDDKVLEKLAPFFEEEAIFRSRPSLVAFGQGIAESILKEMKTDFDSLLIGMRMPTWMIDELYDDTSIVEVDLMDDLEAEPTPVPAAAV